MKPAIIFLIFMSAMLCFAPINTQYTINRQAIWSALEIESSKDLYLAMEQVSDADLPVLLALIYIESRFNPNAVSNKGCLGLCQINPRYYPEVLSDWQNPKYNVAIGYRILKQHLIRTKSLSHSLNAYSGDRSGHYANMVLREYFKIIHNSINGV